MAVVNKDFKVKNGLIVEGASGTINNQTILTEVDGDDYILGLVGGVAFITSVDEDQLDVTAGELSVKAEVFDEFGAAAAAQTAAEAYADALTTDDVSEGSTNEYFTDARARGALSAQDGITYDSSTGLFQAVAEGGGGLAANPGGLSVKRSTVDEWYDAAGAAAQALSDAEDYADGLISALPGDGLALTSGVLSVNVQNGIEIDGDSLQLKLSYITDNISSNYEASGAVDAHSDLTTGVHGVTGDVVGTSDAQTLTNKTMGDDLLMDGNQVSGLGTPTQADHAATKSYVDNTATGIVTKPQVLGATSTNIDATYQNGTNGVGATLTFNSNGVFPAEAAGATGWAVGKGILVKNQTNKAQNGRYVIDDMGSESTPYVLRRCSLCDEADEIPGAYTFVQDGNLGGTGWIQVVSDPATFVVGTDDIDVFQFSGEGTYTAGNGLNLNGTAFEIDETITATRTFASDEASAAQTAAESYADGLAVNYDAAGSAAAAQEAAEDYADGLISALPGDGLALTSGVLSVNVQNGIEIDGDSLQLKLSYITDNISSNYDPAGSAATAEANANTYTDTAIGNLDTDDIEEGTAQYFTDVRAKTSAADLLTGATLENITITGDENGLTITAENGVADSTTDDLDEGETNLYFTDERAVTALEAVTPNFVEIDINSVATQIAATTTVETASAVTAHAFPKADYRSAEYLVKVAYGNHTEISKVLLTLDTSDNIAITEYAIVGTNGSASAISADVSGTDVRLRVTTANNNSEVTVVGTLVA